MSRIWIGKYLVQKCLSALPWSLKTNEILQKTLGGLRRPIIHGYPRTLTMLWLLQQTHITLDGAVCVELGTGWDMSSAMTLARTGVCHVHTFDHIAHTMPELRAIALKQLEDKTTPTDTDLPFEVPFEELKNLVGEERAEVEYHAPFDARTTGLADASVDFYYSLATLEHIPVEILKELLKESFRILRPGAYCYHYVQPAMHSYWGSESSVDYLIFSHRTWERWMANSLSYENRLRAVEHLQLIRDAGFEIVRTWFHLDRKALAKLPRMRLAPEFQGFSHEELAQNYFWVIARKPA